jgi:hypothetical protein
MIVALRGYRTDPYNIPRRCQLANREDFSNLGECITEFTNQANGSRVRRAGRRTSGAVVLVLQVLQVQDDRLNTNV